MRAMSAASAAAGLVQADAHAAIHRAVLAQGGKARVHLRRGATCPCPCASASLRPDRRMTFGQVLGDGQRIPHHRVAVVQAGHPAVRRKRAERRPVRCPVRTHACRSSNGMPSSLQQHPWPQRPRRVILVGDVQSRYMPRGSLGDQDSGLRRPRPSAAAGRVRRRILASTTPATVTAPPTRVSRPGRSPSHSQPISTAIGGEK